MLVYYVITLFVQLNVIEIVCRLLPYHSSVLLLFPARNWSCL